MPRIISAPATAKTTITRDAIGRTTQVRREGTWAGSTLGANRDYRYGPRGQLEKSWVPEERTRYFDHDAAGNPTHVYFCHSSVDATCGWTSGGARPSEVTVNTYDAMNRVTFVDHPGAATDVSNAYEADGLLASTTAGDVTQSYTYNKRRLLVGERFIWPAASIDWPTTYGYDANGHQSSLTYRDLHQVTYAPNALGQATRAGSYATGVSYFPNGAVKQFTYGNGIVHVMAQNARGLPETSVDESPSVQVLDDTYVFDANGNVAQIIDGLPGSAGTRTMTYDGLDRLLTANAGAAQGGNAVFAYDPLDNIRQLDQGARQYRHAYHGVYNQLADVRNPSGVLQVAYTHDGRGNIVKRTRGALDDVFTFDRANRMTHSRIGTPTGTTTGGTVSTYTYDGHGRRVREVTGQSTYSMYNQAGTLLHEHDLKTSMRRYYIHLAGSLVAKRLVPTTAGQPTTIRYQHTDALGSPVAETSESGALLSRERMTAYGEPADGSWSDGPGFTGHDMDPTTKLVYMQQRYYDPVIGRFLSVDPDAVETQTAPNFNRYSYAANSPYVFIDPDGRRNGRANPIQDFSTLSPAQKKFIAVITAKNHGIDISNENIEVHPGRGAELTANSLNIYEETFGSRSELVAAIGHEIEVHLDVHIKKRGGSYGEPVDKEQHHLEEAEAFQYNVDNAQRFGNSEAEVAHFKKARDGHAEQAKAEAKKKESK